MPRANLSLRSRMLIAGGAVLAVDRLSKWWVVEWMDLEHLGRIEVLPPYLNFVMAWNRGINFGLFAEFPEVMRWVLVVVPVTILFNQYVEGLRHFSLWAKPVLLPL